MKELETEFEGRGEIRNFHFKQLMKSGRAYMYEKNFEGSISYEVFERRENKQFNCISYPGSNSFGLWAWDYREYNKALKKFNDLSGVDKLQHQNGEKTARTIIKILQ